MLCDGRTEHCDALTKNDLIRCFSPVLQVATKTLPFYKDYFSVPYPLPKIDLIAIADFAAGEWLKVHLVELSLNRNSSIKLWGVL